MKCEDEAKRERLIKTYIDRIQIEYRYNIDEYDEYDECQVMDVEVLLDDLDVYEDLADEAVGFDDI